jgi:hypothetical protein
MLDAFVFRRQLKQLPLIFAGHATVFGTWRSNRALNCQLLATELFPVVHHFNQFVFLHPRNRFRAAASRVASIFRI